GVRLPAAVYLVAHGERVVRLAGFEHLHTAPDTAGYVPPEYLAVRHAYRVGVDGQKLIRIMRNVQVRSPGEVTRGRRLAESGGQAQVETRVLHAPDVPGDVVREELTGRRGLVKEQVVGVLVVPVDRPCEPLPEQGEV